ncbi:MAG: O-antigen ligase family protein [Chitinophagaceae bacterium]
MLFPILIVSLIFSKNSAVWLRVLIIVCILIFLAGIYFSFARAAMLAVMFGFFVAFAIRYRFARFIMPVIYAIILIGFCFLLYNNNYTKLRPHFERTYYHQTFTSHVMATFKGRDLSSMERLYRWIAAVRMSKDRPLTGFGPNTFYYHYKPYALNSFRTYSSNNEEKSTTHNYFLYILAEQGYPGLILYALLIALVFSRAEKIFHRSIDSFDKACVMAIAMMLAACFINNCFSELLETPKIGPLFYLGISLLVILDEKSMKQKNALIKQSKF